MTIKPAPARDETLTIRRHQASDIGWIISQHGDIYASEFGFSPDFEPHIARKLVAFLDRMETPRDCIWIAEQDHKRVGSIAVSKLKGGVAFLNFVLATKEARGQKLGERLLQVAIQHCREQGYSSIQLETYDSLQAARHLYDKAGFKIIQCDKAQALFDLTLDREFWELSLA